MKPLGNKEIKAGGANRWGWYPSLWKVIFLNFFFFLLTKSTSTPHKNIPPVLFHGLPSSSCCCKGSGKETPGAPILHQRGCGGPRDPPTFFLEVEKEAAWTMLGRVCPGGGKKEDKGKGWWAASFCTREMSRRKAEAAVTINMGNWTNETQEHLY